MVNKSRFLKALILILVFLSFFTSCFPQSNPANNSRTTSASTQKLLVTITDASGTVTSSRIIDGNINDRSAIDRFARNIADMPGHSYLGGSWNELNQFVGVVSGPAGRMVIAVRVAD
jgi:hypothetical protein